MHIARFILAAVLIFYAVWGLTLYFGQDRIIFPRFALSEPAAGAPPGIESWTRPIAGGTVEAWYAPASRPAATVVAGPVVVYFHGNGELIDEQRRTIEFYRRLGISVLLPEFRGYGRSAGRPSEASAVADAAAFVARLAQRPEIDARRVAFHGRSLGGGVAAQLCRRTTPAALILESSPASIAGLARRYLVPGFLVRHPFHTDRVVAQRRCPLLIIAGTLDTVVPVTEARALHALDPGCCYLELRAGHNDLPRDEDRDTYEETIVEFLRATGVLAG
jgi:fermentation-respiration switch protein FrsA (DUF1100 family)